MQYCSSCRIPTIDRKAECCKALQRAKAQIPLDRHVSTRSTRRAHAVWPCRACRHARVELVDTLVSSLSTRSCRACRHARVELVDTLDSIDTLNSTCRVVSRRDVTSQLEFGPNTNTRSNERFAATSLTHVKRRPLLKILRRIQKAERN